MRVTNNELKKELLICFEKDELTNEFADLAMRICKWWLGSKSKWKSNHQMQQEIMSNFLFKLNYNWVKIDPESNISSFLVGAIRFRESETYRATKRHTRFQELSESLAETLNQNPELLTDDFRYFDEPKMKG